MTSIQENSGSRLPIGTVTTPAKGFWLGLQYMDSILWNRLQIQPEGGWLTHDILNIIIMPVGTSSLAGHYCSL